MFKVLSMITELPRALARGARVRAPSPLGFSPSVLKGLKPQREGIFTLDPRAKARGNSKNLNIECNEK